MTTEPNVRCQTAENGQSPTDMPKIKLSENAEASDICAKKLVHNLSSLSATWATYCTYPTRMISKRNICRRSNNLRSPFSKVTSSASMYCMFCLCDPINHGILAGSGASTYYISLN